MWQELWSLSGNTTEDFVICAGDNARIKVCPGCHWHSFPCWLDGILLLSLHFLIMMWCFEKRGLPGHMSTFKYRQPFLCLTVCKVRLQWIALCCIFSLIVVGHRDKHRPLPFHITYRAFPFGGRTTDGFGPACTRLLAVSIPQLKITQIRHHRTPHSSI